MKISMEKFSPQKVLLGTLIVFFCSMLILQATLTSGWSVQKRRVNFVTDDGVNLSGTLYVPANATQETPAAGIVVAPGGNTPHTFYASYEIELARRGYVVLAYDYYGTVGSEMSTAAGSGAVAAMKYLTGLSFVDTDGLGATGHSNGGGQASAAITSEYAAGATKRGVVFIGCGISGQDLSVYDGIGLMAIWGKLDEAGQGTFWDVYHEDRLNYGAFAELVGVESSEVEPGKWYSGTDSSVRVIYTPNTFHCLSNIVPSSVSNIVDFFDRTIDGNASELSANSLIYIWQEFAVLLAALALCVMIFPAGALLLEMPFFASLKRPVPQAAGKADAKFWVFLLLPAVISALLVKSTVIQGQTIMGKLPRLFNVQSTNGFIWWFFLSALIAVVFFLVRMKVDKTVSKERVQERLAISFTGLLKSALFGLAAVGVPYIAAVFGDRLVGWYGRVFQSYFAPIASYRVYEFPVYFILFGALFVVFAFIQADGLRLAGASARTDYWLTFLANALPAILFVGYIFGRLLLTHVTPIAGREMSRANGAMMGMLLLYFVVAKAVTYFYKKTGNIYVVAMVNAAFITWLSINTPQFMIF